MAKRKTVAQKGGTSVIDIDDGEAVERVVVPTADADKPERGIPQGEDWASMITVDVTAQMIDSELKRRGIFEYPDLLNTQQVMGAIQAAFAPIFSQLMNAAKAARTTEGN